MYVVTYIHIYVVTSSSGYGHDHWTASILRPVMTVYGLKLHQMWRQGINCVQFKSLIKIATLVTRLAQGQGGEIVVL